MEFASDLTFSLDPDDMAERLVFWTDS